MTTGSTRLGLFAAVAIAIGAPGVADARQAGTGVGPARVPPRAVEVTPEPNKVFNDRRDGPQAFSVVLVLGDMAGAAAPDTVPAAARKALADMKDFLPYKGYRLLDAQWTLCCGRAPVVTRLRGADDQEYELELSASVFSGQSSGPATVSVRFQLRDQGRSETDSLTPGDTNRVLNQQYMEAQRRVTDLKARLQSGAASAREVEQAEERLRSLARDLESARSKSDRMSVFHGGRAVIDTSFRMDVGETVVVGTSRVKGNDKALIALLTAVPQKASTAPPR